MWNHDILANFDSASEEALAKFAIRQAKYESLLLPFKRNWIRPRLG